MSQYQAAFCAQSYYHVFNHSVDPELLFRNKENYRFFLDRVRKYLLPVAGFYAYNLLGNHFHFLIRIRDEAVLRQYHEQVVRPGSKPLQDHELAGFVLQQFSNFQNSYAKSYNKVFRRMGRLFIESVKRVEVRGDESLVRVLRYIHYNAVHHKMCRGLYDWPHNSYHVFLTDGPTMLQRQEVLDWFGGREGFLGFHEAHPPDATRGFESLCE